MENYLYFAEGIGANATNEAATYAVSKLIAVCPTSSTTTTLHFEARDGSLTDDLVILTHANTGVVGNSLTMSGSKFKQIARNVASACNAHPHQIGRMITFADADNNAYFGDLGTVITGVAITSAN